MRTDAARELSTDSMDAHKALRIASDIMDTFQAGSQESILECRKIAHGFLGDKVDSAEVYDSDGEIIAYGIGHCHIGPYFSPMPKRGN